MPQLYTTIIYIWLLSNAPVNLIQNVVIDFHKNVVPAKSFSVSTDVVPYMQNKSWFYTGDYCL